MVCGMLVLGGCRDAASSLPCDVTCFECEGDASNGSIVIVIVVWAL